MVKIFFNMLFEDDVIDSVIKYLENKNYTIRHHSSATEHGYDLVAESDAGVTLIIEAKGQTSSMKGTNRYGKEFSPSQKNDHVPKAVFKAMQTQVKEGTEIGIALPSDQGHTKLVNSVYSSLKKLGVRVFFVEGNGNVIEK